MIRKLIFTLALGMAASSLPAQNRESVQVHGFATQGFIYSSNDNYLTSRSSDGDAGWTDAVLSVSDNPTSKLRIGIQLHYLRLGDLNGDAPQIDWALGDYKVNDYFGIRAGKVKTPLGLFNDTQDIDAVFLWSLLPQSMYQIDNRSFYLAHWGGEIYGSASLTERGGKLSYRIYGGQNSLSQKDGFGAQIATGVGLIFPNPLTGPVYGGDARWATPYKPLLIGVSVFVQHLQGTAPNGSADLRIVLPAYYAQFDRSRLYFAAEYRRQPIHGNFVVGPSTIPLKDTQNLWYAIASYRATRKLQVGTYYSHMIDTSIPKREQASSSKDLVLSSRFDFNANFYAKAESHFLHGTALGFYQNDNPKGTGSRTIVGIVKLGFDF